MRRSRPALYPDQTPVTGVVRERADVRVSYVPAGDHDAIRDEARELLQQVQAKSVEYDPDRKVRHVGGFSLPSNAVHRCWCFVPAHTFIS